MVQAIITRSGLSLLLIFMSLPTVAEPEILGWLEGAYLQPWGVRVRAKLDTGALTSSMHAEKIEEFEKDSQTWIRFHFPYGKKEGYKNGFLIESQLLRKSTVKEHVGDNVTRNVIEINVCISGDTFPVQVSLADRTNFNYPMILGRRAMSGRFMIDPGRTFAGKRACPRRNKRSGMLE